MLVSLTGGFLAHQTIKKLLKMQKILFTALLLISTPAIAVDYVQCREMLRTKNELQSLGAKTEVDFEGSHPLPTECSGWMLDELSKQKCSDAINKDKSTRKVYMRVGERNIYSQEAARLFNASLKVGNDMIKAGCPYR
jgi:hypothetical protein